MSSLRVSSGVLPGFAGGYGRLAGVDAGDREQRQAKVAHLLQQPVQRSLVGDWTSEAGRAVAVEGEAEAVEPGGPAGSKVPFKADFVPFGLVRIVIRSV